MNGSSTTDYIDAAALIAAERPWLVRVCAALTNDIYAAEDLAQETLLEALRLRDRLYDLQGLRPWLRSIARHVCARWGRWRGQDRAHSQESSAEEALFAELPDSWDLEVELERDELAALLDRALALLPIETRSVLVARYFDETPHATIAQRLGLSEGAVAMRLQRGRLALKRVLGDELRHEAAAYGLIGDRLAATQPTGIWCPICGQQRLNCLIDREHGVARFVCPDCDVGEARHIASTYDQRLIADVRSPKAILSRQLDYLHMFYRQALQQDEAPCLGCGRTCAIDHELPSFASSAMWGRHGFVLRCDRCDFFNAQSLSYLVLDLPEVQRFWRKHPRMRMRPERAVMLDGRSASLITFESVVDSARIDVISAIDTLEVLKLHDRL